MLVAGCGEFTDDSGCFCARDDMPLLAERYKYVSTVGQGQSAVVIKGQVCTSSSLSYTRSQCGSQPAMAHLD